jgi:hypothetical protein
MLPLFSLLPRRQNCTGGSARRRELILHFLRSLPRRFGRRVGLICPRKESFRLSGSLCALVRKLCSLLETTALARRFAD